MIKEIPVSPHVKQFLMYEFGAEPVAIHSLSFMGCLVNLVAEKSPYRIDAPKLNTQGVCTLKIKFPKSLKYRTISPERARGMGETLDKFFRQQFIMWMKGQVRVTGNENHALVTFYETYQINPDHLDLDTLRKVWRDAKEKNVKYLEKNRLAA